MTVPDFHSGFLMWASPDTHQKAGKSCPPQKPLDTLHIKIGLNGVPLIH